MTTGNGVLNSYLDTALNKRVVSDRILMQDPYDIPTYLALGENAAKFSFANPISTKVEWIERAYPAIDDLTDASLTSATNVTQFTPDDIGLYQVGQVLKIDNELLWVSAVSTTLTVTRAFGGTTAATHANDSAIKICGIARLEGADAGNSPQLVHSTGYNYTQILQKSVFITGTNKVMPKVADYDPWDDEIDAAMEILMLQLNRLPFYGGRAIGSASTPRGAGGLTTFISTNLQAMSSAALTAKLLEDKLQACYDNGGDPDVIITTAWNKRKLNDLYGDRFYREADKKYENFMIDYLENPISGKPVKVIVDRAVPAGTLAILSSDQAGFVALRPFFFEELAKSGDAQKGQVVGEYTFVLANEMHHALMTGLSTTK